MHEPPDQPAPDESTFGEPSPEPPDPEALEAEVPEAEVPEARGPHLPDRWPAFLFVVLGIATAWVSYLEVSDTAWTIESAAAFLLDLSPVLCSVLLPAALLLRHPDAPRRARPLLFGTLLLAAGVFFTAIEGSLQGTFKDVTPPPADLEWFVPLALVYNAFQSLLTIFGVLYLALGLTQARHWAYSGLARAAGLAILLVGAGTAAATVYAISQADLSGVTMTAGLWIYLISSIALSVLTTLAWTYLAMVTARCALSGEEPGGGWYVAALGAAMLVATFAIGAWANLVRTPNEALLNVVFWLTNSLYALGYLALLLGFVLGVPSLEPVESEAGDVDDSTEAPDDMASDAEPDLGFEPGPTPEPAA